MDIATCIGCGCTDFNACHDHESGTPCSWIVVDYAAGYGVCSCCQDQMERRNKGDRSVRMVVAKVAKVTQEGQSAPYYIERNDMDGFAIHFGSQVGDQFMVEWVEMSSGDFEALPQFEHIRLAKQWWQEFCLANETMLLGNGDDAKRHKATADQLEARLAELGYDARELLEQMEEY